MTLKEKLQSGNWKIRTFDYLGTDEIFCIVIFSKNNITKKEEYYLKNFPKWIKPYMHDGRLPIMTLFS